MKKPLIISGAVVAAGMSGLIGVTAANAASTTSQTGLADRIASTFHLNSGEVQKVVDQYRTERKAAHEQHMQQQIDQAIKDGKISQDVADQLKAKMKDLRSYHDSLKDKTPQERHDLMKAKITELESWAKANNIPQDLWHHGMGHREMKVETSDDSGAQTAQN